jgi:hypothetical protein
MELIKLKRATYRGVGLFANGKQLNRVTAFGATGTLSKEEVFELGNPDIIEIVEDSPEVSMTIDANEYGSLDTIKHLAGLDEIPVEGIKFSEVFENANVPIWNYVKENADTETVYTQLMTGAVLTNYSANFSTDGNSTESFSLTADNKTWLLNEGRHVVLAKLSYTEGNWVWGGGGSLFTIAKVMSVSHGGRILSANEYVNDTTLPSKNIVITIDGSKQSDKVYAVFAGEYTEKEDEFIPSEPSPTTHKDTIKRRGHIEVYLYNSEEEEIKVTPAQSVSIDVSLNREDIPALGFKRFYDRPLALPIDVTASIDVIFTDLELFAQLCSKDAESDTDLSLDDFRNDLGLKVTIFDRTDVDGKQNPVKILEIPRLIPSDEVWNISLDGQATQTFSFRGMELIVKKGS